jgi:hypothetical protein
VIAAGQRAVNSVLKRAANLAPREIELKRFYIIPFLIFRAVLLVYWGLRLLPVCEF